MLISIAWQSRIKWMASLGNELGGLARAEAFVRGQGVGLILKSIKVQFRRPVTYPDTVRVQILRVTCLLFYQKNMKSFSLVIDPSLLLLGLRMMTLRLSTLLRRLIPSVNVPLWHIRMKHWSGTIMTS